MVNPLMQGFVLMGIIYWYSKGMMSLINDYYRGEFNRKLRDEILDKNDSLEVDVDDFDQLINAETLSGSDNERQVPTIEKGFHINMQNKTNATTCFKPTNLVLFMEMVLKFERKLHNYDYCEIKQSLEEEAAEILQLSS